MSCDICVAVCWTFLFEFSPQGVRGCSNEPESDIVQACRSVCPMTFHPPLSIAMYLFKFMVLNSLLIHEVSRSTAGHECVAVYSDYQWVCPFPCPILIWWTRTWICTINILPWFIQEKRLDRKSEAAAVQNSYFCWWEFPVPCWGCSHDCKAW